MDEALQSHADTVMHPAACRCETCASPAGVASGFVYAIGRITAHFPTAAIEREYHQAVARGGNTGTTDAATLRETLSRHDNRYLARSMCWVLAIECVPAYIVKIRDPFDLEHLLASLRESPSPADLDAVVGTRGPIAPAETCGGRSLPIVAASQIFSFDLDALLKGIATPVGTTDEAFAPVVVDLFTRIQQLTGNLGTSDAHRAANYLAMRSASIYELAAARLSENSALTEVDSRPAPTGGRRRVRDVVFTFTRRGSGAIEKYAARVDVTEEFPFLVSPLMPFIDR